MADLTENQKDRIRNINAIRYSIGTLGAISGAVYANKTGGGFWRYVGYWIVGGLVAGIPAMLITTPFINKILKDADKGESSKTVGTKNVDELLKSLNQLTMGFQVKSKEKETLIANLQKQITDLGYTLIPGNGGIAGGFYYTVKKI